MASKLNLTKLEDLRVTRHQIPAQGLVPNTSLQNRPLMIYHSALPSSCNASAIEAHLSSVQGGVQPAWRYTMFDYDHFHSTSHEVLCIASGAARCSFGLKDKAGSVSPVLQKGDVVIVPAGVSHRLVEEVESPFEMVGSYPRGCNWDMCYGNKGEEEKTEQISSLKWFQADPIYGDVGPTLSS